MSQQKYKMLKFAALAVAVATAGGCVTAKTNPGDEQAMAAPAPAAAVAAPMAAADTGPVTSYTVASGDNLWNISDMEEIYATPYNWPLILKANSGEITDADLIYPGQVFDIPRGMGQSEIDAAQNHAKTRGAWAVGSVEASDTAYLSM